MQKIKEKSIDMILCDLPYGTTACAWDSTIPLDLLWEQYKKIIKPTGAIVLFGSQPFTSLLVSSNLDWFKYSWIWHKNRATGHVHAKNKPMKIHEDICIFSGGTTVHASQSKKRMTYNPQGLIPLDNPILRVRNDKGDDTVLSARKSHHPTEQTNTGYPNSLLYFPIEMNEKRWHPTQKPLALCEYLIKTYSNKHEIVLDNCIGSGTTALAAINTDRHYIGFEKDPEIYNIAINRVKNNGKTSS
ncbi:TPA: site-specific DNA-methyltransferase [Neisseria cinerea]